MSSFDAAKRAGEVLRRLIQTHYASQEEFAYDYGLDIRSVSRYINNGIGKVATIQELADFFHVDLIYFFTVAESPDQQS